MTQKSKNTKAKKRLSKESILEPNDMNDVLPADMPLWDRIEKLAFCVAEYYNFSQIETPILEKLDLFERARIESDERNAGKHLLVKANNKWSLVLRNDMRVPTMRSYIANGFTKLPQPQRLFYIGPVFKEDEETKHPVELHELGFEIIGGSTDPIFDVQVINVAYKFLEDLKIKNLVIKINSSGCLVCRQHYRKKLINYYTAQDACVDCNKNLSGEPMDVLSCDKKKCEEIKAGVPNILDSLCNNCNKHFKGTLEFLEEIGRPYMLDSELIASADYYDKTIFEIVAEDENSTLTLASGGRYDYLAEAIGGRSTPAVGVTISLRKIFDYVRSRKLINLKEKNKVFLVYVGDLAKRKSLSLIEEFSRHNVPIIESLGKDSITTQLEFATYIGSPIGLIFGQKEAYEETVMVRDMKTGMQETVPLKKIVEEVKKRLKDC